MQQVQPAQPGTQAAMSLSRRLSSAAAWSFANIGFPLVPLFAGAIARWRVERKLSPDLFDVGDLSISMAMLCVAVILSLWTLNQSGKPISRNVFLLLTMAMLLSMFSYTNIVTDRAMDEKYVVDVINNVQTNVNQVQKNQSTIEANRNIDEAILLSSRTNDDLQRIITDMNNKRSTSRLEADRVITTILTSVVVVICLGCQIKYGLRS